MESDDRSLRRGARPSRLSDPGRFACPAAGVGAAGGADRLGAGGICHGTGERGGPDLIAPAGCGMNWLSKLSR
jgi:hypothetical protein